MTGAVREVIVLTETGKPLRILSNDLDAPGFLQSYDPETGKRKWIFYTVPMNPGDPGLETWPSLSAVT